MFATQVQNSRVTDEGPDRVRKRANLFWINREVEAIDYVRKHTNIPLPTVVEVHLDYGEDKNAGSWFLMTRLPGSQLGQSWSKMTESARSETIRQLRLYLEELHSLRPPEPGWIGSISHGPAYDQRITKLPTWGPFESIKEFHDLLVAPCKEHAPPEVAEEYRHLLSDNHRVAFAHADLSWDNVLVDPETGDVTGLLNWEMSGFWPEWWEYRKALYGARSQDWWMDIVKQVMQAYPTEADTDLDLEAF